MALELSEVKLELSSCMEIMQILQEEIRLISSSYQPSENKANEDSANKEPNNAAASGDWTYHSSNRSRYPRFSRRNPRQLPLITINQFAQLTNLNEAKVYPRHGPPVKRSQPLHDHLLKRRPVKQCVNKTQNVKQRL